MACLGDGGAPRRTRGRRCRPSRRRSPPRRGPPCAAAARRSASPWRPWPAPSAPRSARRPSSRRPSAELHAVGVVDDVGRLGVGVELVRLERRRRVEGEVQGARVLGAARRRHHEAVAAADLGRERAGLERAATRVARVGDEVEDAGGRVGRRRVVEADERVGDARRRRARRCTSCRARRAGPECRREPPWPGDSAIGRYRSMSASMSAIAAMFALIDAAGSAVQGPTAVGQKLENRKNWPVVSSGGGPSGSPPRARGPSRGRAAPEPPARGRPAPRPVRSTLSRSEVAVVVDVEGADDAVEVEVGAGAAQAHRLGGPDAAELPGADRACRRRPSRCTSRASGTGRLGHAARPSRSRSSGEIVPQLQVRRPLDEREGLGRGGLEARPARSTSRPASRAAGWRPAEPGAGDREPARWRCESIALRALPFAWTSRTL